MKNALYNFIKPKVTSSDVLFCPTNSLKPKYIQFTCIYDKEKLQASHFRSWNKGVFDF